MSSFDRTHGKMGVLNPSLVQMQQEEPFGYTEDISSSSDFSWMCISCGKTWKSGKFCQQCGTPKPKGYEGWRCSCGNQSTGDVCSACGAPKPDDVCGQCGWKPAEGSLPSAFCPECGYVIHKEQDKPFKVPDSWWGSSNKNNNKE